MFLAMHGDALIYLYIYIYIHTYIHTYIYIYLISHIILLIYCYIPDLAMSKLPAAAAMVGSWGFCGIAPCSSGSPLSGLLNPKPYPKLPKPTFLQGPYKFYIRVYKKNLQKSMLW